MRFPRRLPGAALALVIAFVISRLVFALLGLRYDARLLDAAWQFMDPSWLREELLRSLLYYHAQPPLFNAGLGAIYKLFSGHEVAVLATLYHLFGLALCLGLYALLRVFRVRTALALVLTVLWTISPAAILYEEWAFYTYPLALMLVLAVLLCYRYLRTGGLAPALGLFVLLAAIALTRSMFHFAWFALCVGLVLAARPASRRRTLMAAALPGLAILGWMLKNLIVFGGFWTSSWLGMSLWHVASWPVPEGERVAMIQQGLLSPAAAVKSFSPLEAYGGAYGRAAETGIRALDQTRKADGSPNFNHASYLAISKDYLRDSFTLVRRRPLAYAKGVLRAFTFYFTPATDYSQLDANRPLLQPWERLYDVAAGQIANLPPSRAEREQKAVSEREKLQRVGLLLVLALPLVFAFGCRQALRWRADPLRHTERFTLGFLLLNVAYVTAVGNLVECGENMRFRFMLEPFFVVLGGLMLGDLFDKRPLIGRRFLRRAGG